MLVDMYIKWVGCVDILPPLSHFDRWSTGVFSTGPNLHRPMVPFLFTFLLSLSLSLCFILLFFGYFNNPFLWWPRRFSHRIWINIPPFSDALSSLFWHLPFGFVIDLSKVLLTVTHMERPFFLLNKIKPLLWWLWTTRKKKRFIFCFVGEKGVRWGRPGSNYKPRRRSSEEEPPLFKSPLSFLTSFPVSSAALKIKKEEKLIWLETKRQLIGSFLSIQLFLLSSVKCFAVFFFFLPCTHTHTNIVMMTILLGFYPPVAEKILRRFVSLLLGLLVWKVLI